MQQRRPSAVPKGLGEKTVLAGVTEMWNQGKTEAQIRRWANCVISHCVWVEPDLERDRLEASRDEDRRIAKAIATDPPK